MVPDPAVQPTMTMDEVATALGISRTTAYQGAKSGEIPVVRVRGRLMAPTAAIRRLLQLDDAPEPAA